jgi:predicted ester cyclase
MSMRRNTALVLRFYEKFDNGELDAFDPRIGSNFLARVLGAAELDWHGFKQFGRAFRAAFPDGRHEFDHVVADGDRIVSIGSYVGTQTGEIEGIAPTKRRIRLAVMHLDRVVDDRIVEHRGLANERDFMRQLGVELVPATDVG